ncbi:hypothetical protein H5410_009367 [Solanum commersonii]|uniref:NYN domain-containing protein n=1 Tax=Solanum commersonii TaxID=4109 RepID=A0A9J6AHN6_SOLCO|nr:hypothetical protein H5410_009367 [Solanum commersonii]
MAGDGLKPGFPGGAVAGPQYAAAKTSVWWDIENCQVPRYRYTGVKDASDKKILVDMLFWAVDNPAAANYLLISGSTDFSYVIHQLRMRRYNILLAQPFNNTSPALAAAATNVWQWTTLAAGGYPRELAFRTNTLHRESIRTPIFEPIPAANQSAYSNANAMLLGSKIYIIPDAILIQKLKLFTCLRT